MFFSKHKNCWQVAETERVAFLVDGEAYFSAVADACEAARRAIYIIGWDIDSRIRLRRNDAEEQEGFAEFLNRLAYETPDLKIYILEWDFSMLYSMERETLPLLSLGWETHERVHFELDDKHPVGASHHQKIVVIDDRLAFVGGFDLTSSRWDTPEHALEQPKRYDNGKTYGPFHDVQTMVDGGAASALGCLARARWEQATGDELAAVDDVEHDPWPESVAPDLEQVQIAILRTIPEYDGIHEIREIEGFYLDAIDQAKSSIYIENQYLTSHVIGTALEKSLRKQDGPEILIVLPRKCSGWLEEETMGALRQHLLNKLLQADEHQRLKICYPDREGLKTKIINVHSKILVIDDTLLTVGSANLSNRSMGFDTECNLALSAEGQAHIQKAIAGFRNRLLAEHLGTTKEKITASLEKTGALLATVDALNKSERSLQDLAQAETDSLTETLSASEIVDPERPINMERLLDYFDIDSDSRDDDARVRQKAWRFAMVIALALLLAILWRWSPLSQWLTMDNLLAIADTIRESPMTTPIVLAIYIIGSCLMFPVTLIILATALSFGPYTGFALAFSGSLLGGLASYLLGRWLGRDVVRRLAGEKVNRLSRKLARRGWLAVALVRMVPIAPYTIVNMVAGSSHISTRSFLIGTAIGMGPGILAIMLFEGGLEHAIREPGWSSVVVSLIALSCALLILFFFKRWLMRKDADHEK
jgi:phosphatidylserine/phosphatidylglycerophosphate/cardiolipin synthase-like enzyme/membrane protein DedA with SNARE-associated domain